MICLRYIGSVRPSEIKWIEWCGQNSLAIYLWHAVVIVMFRDSWEGTLMDYLLSLPLQLVSFALIFCGTKVKLINQYAFGIKS